MPDTDQSSTTLKQMIDGYQLSQALHVVARLGIADLIADAPKPCDDLATQTGVDPAALYRLLRLLAAAGVFREADGRAFSLAPLGDALRTDAPDSVRDWAAFIGQSYQWAAWGALFESVRTGANAFRLVHGIGAWEYRARHPEQGQIFDRAMVAVSRRQSAAVIDAFDFGRFHHLVDVGGGRGALLAGILARYPRLHGTLVDQPHVLTTAEPFLQGQGAGIRERCRIVAGDFFASVPSGGDAYLLKAILHDWDDARAVAILKTCRAAMGPEATLLVIEMEIRPEAEGLDAALTDLRMLVGPGGQERSRAEYATLLAGGGFQLVASHPTGCELQVIEARPA